MPKTDQSILVDAPVREVFAFVADYRNITRFERRFSRVEALPGPHYGLGTTLDARGWFRGVPVRARLRTVEFVPDKRIVSHSVSGLKSVLEWEFTGDGQATRVRMVASYAWPFPLLPRHVKESIEQEIEELSADSLRELKRILESGEHRMEETDTGE